MDDEKKYAFIEAEVPQKSLAKPQPPIDKALTDLHNNIEDAHQLMQELEVKIFAILSPSMEPTKGHDSAESAETENSRIHDAIRAEDDRVAELQDRIRSLIRRVEL